MGIHYVLCQTVAWDADVAARPHTLAHDRAIRSYVVHTHEMIADALQRLADGLTAIVEAAAHYVVNHCSGKYGMYRFDGSTFLIDG